ncbi:MAG: diguanylate cyclase, partial [Thermoanaerobaculia bacterium]
LQLALSGQRELLSSEELVQTSETLLRLVLEAETGERGFALTGHAPYLVPFESAGRSWTAVVHDLEVGFAGDSEQLERLRRIDEQFSVWLSQVALPVISRRRELPPSHMEAIRDFRSALFALLEEREEGRLGEAASAQERRRALIAELRQALQAALTPLDEPSLRAHWSEVLQSLAVLEGAIASNVSPAARSAATYALLRRANSAADASIAAERLALAPITSGAGKERVDAIRRLQGDLVARERGRLETVLARSARRERIAIWVAIGGLALALMLGVVSTWLLSRHFLMSLRSIGRAAEKLAAGDLRQRLAQVEGDDLGRLARSFNLMADRLAAREREVTLLHDLGQLLQSAIDEDEALQIVARLLPALMPGTSGSIFVLTGSRNELKCRASFGGGAREGPRDLPPSSCWSIRTGQTYFVLDPATQVLCDHLATPAWPYICVPLSAQGQTLGLLHLESPPEGGADRLTAALGLLPAVASEVALALGNLTLRAELLAKSVRDPLTGLFNRRYLEETLAREIDRSQRKTTPLSVAIVDLDHFKGLNDKWGHEAGDQVLKRFSELLQAQFRTQDVLCRYGGEEFALVFPDCTLDQAEKRAEGFLGALQALEISYGSETIRGLNASIGIAGFPQHGRTQEALLRQADHALYEAKRGGRAQVRRASQPREAPFGDDTRAL